MQVHRPHQRFLHNFAPLSLLQVGVRARVSARARVGVRARDSALGLGLGLGLGSGSGLGLGLRLDRSALMDISPGGKVMVRRE